MGVTENDRKCKYCGKKLGMMSPYKSCDDCNQKHAKRISDWKDEHLTNGHGDEPATSGYIPEKKALNFTSSRQQEGRRGGKGTGLSARRTRRRMERERKEQEELHAMDKPKPLEVVSDGDLSEVKKDPVWKTWLKQKDAINSKQVREKLPRKEYCPTCGQVDPVASGQQKEEGQSHGEQSTTARGGVTGKETKDRFGHIWGEETSPKTSGWKTGETGGKGFRNALYHDLGDPRDYSHEYYPGQMSDRDDKGVNVHMDTTRDNPKDFGKRQRDDKDDKGAMKKSWEVWLDNVTKPIPDSKGGRGSFQHCIDANQDKNNPGGWCKQIERKIGKGHDPGDDSPRRGHSPHDDPAHGGDKDRRGHRPDERRENQEWSGHGKRPYGHGRQEDDVIPKDSFQNTRGMKLEEKPDPEDETDRLRNEPVYGNVALPRVERKPTRDFQSRISQLGSKIQDKKIRDAITNRKMPDTKELRSDADRATISHENAELWKMWLKEKAKKQTKIDKPKDWWDHSKVGRQGDIDQKTGRPWWEVATEEKERRKREAKEKTDYFVEEIRSNIIYHNKILPIIGMVAGQAARGMGKGAKKLGGELLEGASEVGQGMLQGVAEEEEE